MSLRVSLQNFQADLLRYRGYIYDSHRKDQNGNFVVSFSERDFISSAAFLGIFKAWEGFLEDATIKYLRGKRSASGNYVKRFVSPLDDKHAHEIILGTNRYLDWANPEIIRLLVKNLFHPQNPIEAALSSINSDLLDLKTIRNSAAHISTTTSSQLDGLASRKLGTTISSVSVSVLIMSIDPNGASATTTILDTYITLLDAAAVSISNY